MANIRVLNSGLHRGERFWISTPDNIPLCRLWKKHGHNNRKMPGLVRQIWVTYLDKSSHHGKLWGRKHLLTHIMPSWGNGTRLDTWDLDSIEEVPPEEHSGDPTTERTIRKKASGDSEGSHMMVIIICLFVSLSSLLLPHPPSYFFLPPHPSALSFTVK